MMKPEDCYVAKGADVWTEAFAGAEMRPTHGRTAAGARLLDKPFGEWAPRLFAQRSCKPLALYIHVPYCRHRCLFCPFYQNRSTESFSAYYADLLMRHLDLLEEALGRGADCRPVDAVFFGGGTPSDLSAPDLARVLKRLRALFAITDETEITVEGRIRDFTPEKAVLWREAGANRFSLGLQSTDVALRRRLGRLADRHEMLTVLNGLADTGAVLIVDLIFGLPGQTRELLLEDLRFLAQQTHIDGLDLYELIQFPNSPLARAVAEGRAGIGEPPDRAGRARMFAAAAEALAGYGFEHFTPQHWRRGTRERSVYNRLAKSNADILPIGSSAGGNLSRVSIMMERDIDAYAAQIHAGKIPARCLAPTEPISEQERFKTSLAEAAERLSVPTPSQWPLAARGWAAPLLENWTQVGLLEAPAPGENAETLKMTPAGAYWAKVMQRLIIGCLSPASAESAHPGGSHPHGGGKPPHGHPGSCPSMPGHIGGSHPHTSGHRSHPGEAGGGHPRGYTGTLVR